MHAMTMLSVSRIKWWGGVLGGVLVCATGGAQPLARSPFLPPNTPAETALTVTENASLQFVGQLGEGDGAMYSVFNPSTRRSVWLRVGEETETFSLQSYDADTETVRVVQGGQVVTLRLGTAKAAAGGGAVAAGPLPMVGGNALTNTVRMNPTPADEARRLEAVAAEVRRRRALRQQAAEQAAQNTPQ